MSTIILTQSLTVVSRTVGSLPNAPALDAAPRIVKRLNSELVRRLVLAAIFEPRHCIPLDVLEDYMAFCGGWPRYVVRRSLQEMASRSMPTSIQTFPQPDEIVPAPRNALIVRKVAITIAKPRISTPSAQELAFLLSSLDVCASAQEGLWLDNISVLLYGLQAEVPSRALSVVSPSEVHVNIDLMLLLASRASSFPLLVDLGPETSVVEVASGDDDDYVSTVSPAGVSNRVTVKKLTIAPRVSISNARDIAAVLGDLDICVSAPKGLWLDISISPRSLEVDISMAPRTISQLEDHITIDLLLLLASRVASSFPLLVDHGSDTSIVEVISHHVNTPDFDQTSVDVDSMVIPGPQDAPVNRSSVVTVKSQVPISNARNVITLLGDLDICAPASRGFWFELPFLPRSLLFGIPLITPGTQLGNRINIDLVLSLASMVTSRASSFPRLVDFGSEASSIIEIGTQSDEVSIDTDRTLIEDICIELIKKGPITPLARALNPNASVFVPPSTRLPSDVTQESVDSSKTELEAPAPLSRRAKARRLATARKRRAQLSEIHASPLPSSTPAPTCPPVYPSLNDTPTPPPMPAFHEYPYAQAARHTIGAMPAPSFSVQPMHVPIPQSHHYSPFPSAPPPPVYYGPGYRPPSRMPAPRPPRQMYLDAHRYLPPAFAPTPVNDGPPMMY